MSSNLPELGYLVTEVGHCHRVQDRFGNVQVSRRIHGVDDGRIEGQVQQRKEYQHGVLIHRSPHPFWAEMRPVGGIVFFLVLDESRWIARILAVPASPEVLDAFLIAGRPYDPQCVYIDRPLDHINRMGLLAFPEYGISFQEGLPEEIILVFFSLNSGLSPLAMSGRLIIMESRISLVHMTRNDLTCESTAFEEAGPPQFLLTLLLEPPVAYEQAVYNAGAILVPAGPFRRLYDLRRDDVAVGLGNGRPLQLEGDDLLNQVFQTESDLCDLL